MISATSIQNRLSLPEAMICYAAAKAAGGGSWYRSAASPWAGQRTPTRSPASPFLTAFLVSDRAAAFASTDYVIDGGAIPKV
ncbi:MAG: short-chain dehydrogenase [Rhizorhabdus sp.]|uniref:short-chain dehydrogenase n=1 Tax=Rhizorhabdus sp. TaxID=1968843 RepID=UPI001B59FC92|nr:short-chain dehydrogenase [Rhizorhabdus sp.]MBP8236009.1 short-chain dehydrogenase [Rhizorhabdus sp.]